MVAHCSIHVVETREVGLIAGIDSHKDTLSASIIEAGGRQTAAETFPNTPDGHGKLAAWLSEHGSVQRIGIEGAGGYGRALALHLARMGMDVVEVTARLTVRERQRQPRPGKSDSTDAVAIARISAREDDLPPIRQEGFTQDLKALLDYREQLIAERTRIANRVHASLVTLRPGYQTRCRALNTNRSLTTVLLLIRGDSSVQAELIRRRVRDLRRLDAEARALKQRITALVRASGTSLTQIHGIGFLVAARILAEVGDVRRFRTKSKFAAANGTAPISASSGRTNRHRLNRGGNRKLNRALHTAALTQARDATPGQRYVDHKQSQGKTRREAIRCLKRRISDAVYRCIRSDLAVSQLMA